MDENLITDPIQILDDGQNFYQNLYSENVGHDESPMTEIGNTFTNTDSLPKIGAIQQEHCERLVAENDLLKSLKAFKNGGENTRDRCDKRRILNFFLAWHETISSSQHQLLTRTWHVIYSTKKGNYIACTKGRQRPLLLKELVTNIFTERRLQNFSKGLSQ